MLRSQLRTLIAKKELKEQRRITYREIEGATHIPASTLSRFAQGKISRFEAKTILALCLYFDCDVGDILTSGRKKEQEEAK